MSSVGSATSCQRSQMVRSPTHPSPSKPVYFTLQWNNHTSPSHQSLLGLTPSPPPWPHPPQKWAQWQLGTKSGSSGRL